MDAWAHIREAERLAKRRAKGDVERADLHLRIANAMSLATIYDPASTPEAVVRGTDELLADLARRSTPHLVRHSHDPDTA